ncbi:hypothetical protein [Alteromonas sp. CYL-A6]|uniref:hypothetical protein n=1 Tax=Alteromonas nitratireducens TaxID=3390813 RepID=UPI0034B29165
MPVYSALVFDGKRQHVIQKECPSETQFIAELDVELGVHVCLWLKEMPQDDRTPFADSA